MNRLLNENFAHIGLNKKENISQHNELCLKYFDLFKNELIGNDIFEKHFLEKELLFLKEMIVFHDIGKINPKFQTDKMKNKKNGANRCGDSNHSNYSAYFYLVYMLNTYVNNKTDIFEIYKIFNYAYLISRHHTYLKDFDDSFLDEMEAVEENSWVEDVVDDLGFDLLSNYENLDSIFQKMLNISKTEKENLKFYVKNKIAYSLLVCCDFAAAYEFFNEEEFKIYKKLDVSSYIKGELYQKIINKPLSDYNDNDINKLRTQMALEVKDNVEKQEWRIANLIQPCGAGKTNTGLMTACLTLLKYNQKGIIYTSPFNSITDQNANVFKTYFENIQTINSTSAINEIDYGDENDIEKLVMDYQMNNFPFICTSHVHLFNMLFGTRRLDALGLLFLSNRIIIMDEIQGYFPKLWEKMLTILNVFSECLNFKILFMSATMPSFEKLVNNFKIIDLLPNNHIYFNNPIFKDRVKFNVIGKIESLLDIIKDKKFYSNKKVLYEFQTKKSAREFFELLKEELVDVEIFELTGDSNIFERQKIINRVQNTQEVIVVSTQVIEAGVDLDFDYGFKEISKPDSEIQFGGRINRSCKKENCYAEFFIYESYNVNKGDPRILSSIINPEILTAISEFNNEKIYDKTIEYLKEMSNNESDKHNYYVFVKNCIGSKYKSIEEIMRLIEGASSLFIAYNIKLDNLSNENIALFIEMKNKFNNYDLLKEILQINKNNIVISGEKVWMALKDLNQLKIEFSEKFILSRYLNLLKNYFSFSVFFKDELSIPDDIKPVRKNQYYTDSERFIIDGRINRKVLSEKSNFL